MTRRFGALVNSTVIVTSAVYGVLLVLATSAGLLGLWLLILVALSLWRYAYAVLSGVAQGRTELVPPSIDSMNPLGNWRLDLHFILFPALLALITQTTPFGTGATGRALEIALALAVVAVFPASAAIIGLTSNLVAALSPASIGSVIKTLGRDYAGLVVACGSLVAIAALVQRWVVPSFGLVSHVVASIVGVWTLLGVFALIGASIHAHRDDFDIPGEQRAPEARDVEERRREWQAELDLAYGALRSDEIEKGYQILRKLIAKNGGSIEVQFWLFENMLDWGDRTHAARVAERLIARLVEIGDLPAALDLYRRCRRLDARLGIRPNTLRLLGRYAREIGQVGLASEIGAEIGGADA